MQNKKAFFDYEILEQFVAGIKLTGPEVKAIRDNKMSFADAFCTITDGEVFLRKMHISVKEGGENEFVRDRKLLLNKKEIDKISKALKEKGLTMVPTSMFVNDTHLIKVGVALARGKKNYDKRFSEKYRNNTLSTNNDSI